MESPFGSRSRVTVRNEGLTLLYEPAEGKAVVNVVFVHGLQGHPKKTWAFTTPGSAQDASHRKSRLLGLGRSSRSKPETDKGEEDGKVVFWPEDLLPKDCPTARIWTLGYDSRVSRFFSGAANQNNIFGHAKNLLYELNREVDTSAGQKLIFVAHSLGGIIVKEILRRSKGNEDARLRNILTATYAIVFLGTPHRGSTYAPMGDVARSVASAVGFDTNDKLVQALQFDSPELELSREEFAQMLRQNCFLVRTFQEGHGMKATSLGGFNEKVVLDMSSSLDDPRERAQIINKNHVDMCRFSGTEDPGYRQVGGELKQLLNDVDRQVQEVRHQESRQAEDVTVTKPLTAEEEGCLRSLSFPQIDNRYHDIKEPLGDTCDWIFQRAEFQEWWRSSQGLLWLKGHAGSAKSTLMKHAVRHFEEQTGILEETSNVPMARHFFNARGVELEKSFLGLMRSLLCQILSRARPLLERFVPAFHRKQITHGSGWEWHAEELRTFILSTLTSQLPPTSLYIDALDECEESERQYVVAFIEALMDRARLRDIPIRVIFSSRHFPDIDIEACQEIHPEEHNNSDISIYVKRRLSRLPDSKGALTLSEEIVRKARGIFLWVVLVTDILLAKKYEPVQVMRDKLLQIPPGLIQLYDSILEGLSHKERENMLQIIQWVLFAERPLAPEELLTAMAFDDEIKYPSFEAWRESGMFIEDQSQIEGLIRDHSRGMIEVKWNQFPDSTEGSSETEKPSETEEQTGTVQFIHESARGFFLHDNEDALAILAPALREKFVGSSHDRLARSCLNFLGIEELRLWYGQAKSTVEALMHKHDKNDEVEKSDDQDRYAEALGSLDIRELPFQSYASKHVFVHAQHAESNKIKQTHFVDLFSKHDGEVLKTWALLHDKIKPKSHASDLLQGPRAALLYAVSCYNLSSVVEFLLQSGVDPNHDCGSRWRFPLLAAAKLGFIEVVRLLLDHKADIEVRGEGERTALHVAAWTGQLEIVLLLLERGANIGTEDMDQNTLLDAAAFSGNEAIIQLLLNRGLAVDAQNTDHQTVLHLVVILKEIGLAQLLLDNKANANIQDKEGVTALHLAAEDGNEAVIRLLLDHGANVEVKTHEGYTALHIAAAEGREAGIRLSLAHVADIVARDPEVRTALHLAATYGREAGIRLLLAYGANVKVQTHKGRTALHIAATHGHKARMLLLLAHGASIETVDHEGRTALHLAAAYGREAGIRLLLAHGANIDIRDHEGRTALQWAMKERRTWIHYKWSDGGETLQEFDEVIQLLETRAEELEIPLCSLPGVLKDLDDADDTSSYLDNRGSLHTA